MRSELESTKRLVYEIASYPVKLPRTIHLALIVIIAMWGLVFVAVARLLPQIDALQLVIIRFNLLAILFIAMFIVVPSTRPHISGWRDWALLIALGVLAVPGSQLAIVNGQNYLSPPLVSLVITTSPAWAALIAAYWLKESVNTRQIIGFLTALVGVSVVILAGVGHSELTVDNPLGAASTLISPVSWALYTILSKTLLERFAPLTAIGMAMITGSLSLIPFYPHAIEGIGEITATGWGWMVYLVIGGTVIPYFVWLKALGQLSAATTTAYMYGIPLAALFWSWAILGIIPSYVALLGGAVIIAGVSMIQFGNRPAATASAK